MYMYIWMVSAWIIELKKWIGNAPVSANDADYMDRKFTVPDPCVRSVVGMEL